MMSFIFAAAVFQSGAAVAPTTQSSPRQAQSAPAASGASLFDKVLQRMTPTGRPIFRRYVDEVLQPKLRADGESERNYRATLRSLVAAPTLDVDAVERLIAGRRQAETALTASVRSTAFAMIRTLPAADRKLALTAIFADARLPAQPRAAPTPPPAK